MPLNSNSFHVSLLLFEIEHRNLNHTGKSQKTQEREFGTGKSVETLGKEKTGIVQQVTAKTLRRSGHVMK